MIFDLRCAVSAKHGEMCVNQFFGDGFGHIDAAADNHKIHIFRWSVQQQIAHIATDEITFQAKFIGGLAYDGKNFVVER